MTPPGALVIELLPVAGDRDSVVEGAGVADRVLGARDAEGLVDRGPAPIGNGVGAVSHGEAVVEGAGIVDRVLAPGDAEDLVDEVSGLVRDAVDAGSVYDEAVIVRGAVDDGGLRIAGDRDQAV